MTYRNVQSAVPMVGCDQLVIANLLQPPTRNAPALNAHPITEAELAESRQALCEALRTADEVFLAWGTGSGMTGAIRRALQSQVRLLEDRLGEQGVARVWTIAGAPRHPSRWRQYVGPEKRRVEGDGFEDRLRKTLRPIAFDSERARLLFACAFGRPRVTSCRTQSVPLNEGHQTTARL